MMFILAALFLVPVVSYDVGCLYPSTMPDPFDVQYALASTATIQAVVSQTETPIVVYGAHLTTYCQSNCIAYHDEKQLNTLTKATPGFRTPPQYWNSWSRTLCIASCWNTLYEGAFTPLAQSWGLDIPTLDPYLLGCGGDSQCIGALVVEQDWSPFLIGQIVALEIGFYSRTDGWNRDGSMNYDPEMEEASPCTANCAPYTDTTGYYPKNNPGKKQEKANGSSKYQVVGSNKFWQPLLEHDGRGYFSRQEHVTPHIGYKVSPVVLEMFPEAPDPKYEYKMEADLVVERLRVLASSNDMKTKVHFFDNKLAVRGLIQDSIRRKFPNHSFEDQMLFIHGISTVEYDATLASWREKVRHDLVRPTTVIQRWGNDEIDTFNGDRDSTGPATIKAKDFQPWIRVMPHSEYPSGSACLCTAYAEFSDVFTQELYGSKLDQLEASPDAWNLLCPGTPTHVPGIAGYGCEGSEVILEDMTELQYVCGQSRLWGGMHFTTSVGAAEEMCSGLGDLGMDYVHMIKAGSDWTNSYRKGDARPTCGN